MTNLQLFYLAGTFYFLAVLTYVWHFFMPLTRLHKNALVLIFCGFFLQTGSLT